MDFTDHILQTCGLQNDPLSDWTILQPLAMSSHTRLSSYGMWPQLQAESL